MKLGEAPNFGGGVWLEDGTIIFAPHLQTGLCRVPAAGGDPKILTTPNEDEGETVHMWPAALPNNDFLFTCYRQKGGLLESRLEVFSRASGARHLVLEGAEFGRYLPSGHLVFVQNGALYLALFDLRSLTLRSKAVPLPERAECNPRRGGTQFVCSGTEAYWRSSRRRPKIGNWSGLTTEDRSSLWRLRPVRTKV